MQNSKSQSKIQKFSVLFVTAPTKKEAGKIAESLVRKRLAACVNIVPNMESIYRWKGRVEKAKELLLIIKTRSALVNRVIKEVKRLHSYTVPEIISLAITAGNQDYLSWITTSTKP